MQPVHVTVWNAAATGAVAVPAVFVHGIFTWGEDAAYGFAAQRPLADTRPLLLVDRRGYGSSPDTARSDFEADAEDLVRLLNDCPDGAHLVGHSHGGLAAMLAAGRRPRAVRSLALIQPSAFRAASDHPAVRELLDRVEMPVGTEEPVRPDGAGSRQEPPRQQELDPAEYLRLSTEGLGMAMPEPTPERLRAVRTSMRERPVWEADPPLEPLAAASWPKLVVSGTWQDAPEPYRRYAGEPLLACAEAVADRIGARRLRVPGYYPHTQHPAEVNAALRALWS
ncbi:alpha/beta fold hydrolase [Streptomyces sp. NP-1717]|uniref:alpha/beta fold hydrolase n=1 Tax=Streptomyces sp. NP-1717 TaxID=2704470 RepID=UPI001F5CBDB5|nr:alpha/beta fold hydrolase [Streptomyces sp. NP-1717]MCI3220885.1 alpha/beta fold hydrolase [Streptomyces sp. NP-1717]